MKARKDNWVFSERVAPKHGETVWIESQRPYGPNRVVRAATYESTEDEDVSQGFFWESIDAGFLYGHRLWQPRFPNQPKPALPKL